MPVASPPTERTVRRGLAFEAAAWWSVLAAVTLVPLLIDAPLLGGDRRTFYSLGYVVKSGALFILVGFALVAWAVPRFTGDAVLRWHRAAWVGTAFLGWAGVSAAFSVSPTTAVFGTTAEMQGLATLCACALLGFLVLQLLNGAPRIRQLLAAVVISGSVAAAYGVAQFFRLDPFAWQSLPWGARRAFATLGNPDMFGAHMALVLFCAVGLAVAAKTTTTRIAWTTCAGLAGVALYASFSRAALVAAVVGAVAFLLVMRGAAPRSEAKSKWVIAGAVVAVVAVLVIMSAIGASSGEQDMDIRARITSALDPSDSNTLGRLQIWQSALAAASDRPLLGTGPGTQILALDARRTRAASEMLDPNIMQDNAHSLVFESLVEYGFVGTALLLAFLAMVAVVSWRHLRRMDAGSTRVLLAGAWASAAGYLAAACLVPSALPSRVVLWSLLGLLLGPLAASVRPRTAWVRVTAVVSVLAGAAFLLAGPAVMVADAQAYQASLQNNIMLSRLEAADRAVRLNPFVSEYRVVAAKAYADDWIVAAQSGASSETLAPSFERSIAYAREAVDLEPGNPRSKTLYASLLVTGATRLDGAYLDEALAAAEQARAASPWDLVARYWQARAQLAAGRTAQAERTLGEALEIRPGYGQAAVLLASVKASREQTAAAVSVLEAAAKAAPDDAAVAAALAQLRGAP